VEWYETGVEWYETSDVWMVPRTRLPILKRFSESRRVGPFTDNSRPVFTTEAQRHRDTEEMRKCVRSGCKVLRAEFSLTL
jgi:hypothetical protein